MIQSLISYVVKLICAFSTRGGILNKKSPSVIVNGKPNTGFKQERILFGSYDLAYTGTRNDMNRRSIPSIALNKSNNHG